MQCAKYIDCHVELENLFHSIRDKISVLGGLSDQQIAKLYPFFSKHSLNAGEVIFGQGQLPTNVYIVLKGKVDLDIECDDGTLKKVFYKEGDCFGETAVIGIQPQLGRARARTETELLVLSRSNLLDIVNQDTELFAMLMMNLAREVSRRLHSLLIMPTSVAVMAEFRA